MRAALVVALLGSCIVADRVALADDAGTRKTLDGAKAALDAELKKADPTRPADTWSLGVTPPFPDGVAWVMYGYPRRVSPQLADGEHIGGVFAEARPTAGGYALKRVTDKISAVGVQGVHPVAATAVPSAQETLAAHGWVTGGHRDAMPEVVKRVYCAWKSGNGVVAGQLPASATNFLASLACR